MEGRRDDVTRRTVLAAGLGAAAVALGAVGTAQAAQNGNGWRVVDAATGKDLRWQDLPGRLAPSNAIFVGEFHDDPQTHRVERALLEEVHKWAGDRLTLAMEMFERDDQGALDDYLAGRTDEAAFGKAARLWPNYATDYKPLIEYAKAKKVPVLASNAPQAIVRRVGREGLDAVYPRLSEAERATVADYVLTPEDDYYRRFAKVMGGGGSGGDGQSAAHGRMDPAMLRRMYEAQCLRDATMAQTIAGALAAGRTVLHINGSFHSDAGLGTAARVLWRRPLDTRLSVVKVVPVKDDVKKADPTADRTEADYLIYVPDERPAPKPKEA